MTIIMIGHAIAGTPSDDVAIAKWYLNKHAAISIRFDDSRDSHVKIAIPLLNQHDIKATFMINPGESEYKKHKDFWEIEVPKMGHRLGNHTMHHKGAANLEVAEYEIGEVSRLIWRLYPNESRLNVFASGGGNVKWGGNLWKNAHQDYKLLVKKYHLIDLYDGFHSSKAYKSTYAAEDICREMHKALAEGRHRAFHFHNVGRPDLKGRFRKLINGFSWDIDYDTFSDILICLSNIRNEVWVAPLIDILKYETQYQSAKLTISKQTQKTVHMDLAIDTKIELYDHDLTLIIAEQDNRKPTSVYQNGLMIQSPPIQQDGGWLYNIRPINSTISIQYE